MSDEFESFLAGYDINHNLTARYNPQANGGVERLNRAIKESLKASLADGKSFSQAITIFLRAYRATPHSLTGVPPAELMIGRNLYTYATANSQAAIAINTEQQSESERDCGKATAFERIH